MSQNRIQPYLKFAAAKKASDLYFTPDSPLQIRADGITLPVKTTGQEVFKAEDVERLAFSLMDAEQKAFFEKNLEIDFAYHEEGVGRFRVNVFRQRNQVAMVMRYVQEIPYFDDLGLPPVLKDLIMHKRGLILMVGATGSGKSTTLAALIRHRNENASGHILTIEDPIEFYHKNHRSLVNQREVGTDTLSYENALRSAVREAPDVILIGESRDRETMESCIQLAGTGHLAISTLHANNAYQAMQRVLALYPEEFREQLYLDLSINLRAIISQRLIPAKEGGRVAAVEVMVNTPYISDLISKGKISEMRESMQQSSEAGTQTFDDSLIRLYQDGKIELEEALSNADSRTNLETKLNFGG